MKVVWVNGCFDILHRGHIEMFKYAKSVGDLLVVGIDSDERISKNKGQSRPVNCLNDRRFILESIKYIDSVVSFASDKELKENILKSKASIMVIGTDYKNKKIIGSDIFEEIKFFKRIDKYSTTNIIKDLNEIRI